MDADELQCLLIFSVFVAGMLDKGLNNFAASIFFDLRKRNVLWSGSIS